MAVGKIFGPDLHLSLQCIYPSDSYHNKYERLNVFRHFFLRLYHFFMKWLRGNLPTCPCGHVNASLNKDKKFSANQVQIQNVSKGRGQLITGGAYK